MAELGARGFHPAGSPTLTSQGPPRDPQFLGRIVRAGLLLTRRTPNHPRPEALEQRAMERLHRPGSCDNCSETGGGIGATPKKGR